MCGSVLEPAHSQILSAAQNSPVSRALNGRETFRLTQLLRLREQTAETALAELERLRSGIESANRHIRSSRTAIEQCVHLLETVRRQQQADDFTARL
jgi:hypothetical protein